MLTNEIAQHALAGLLVAGALAYLGRGAWLALSGRRTSTCGSCPKSEPSDARPQARLPAHPGR